MARRDLRRKAKAPKTRRHETLESRVVMSADPLPMLGLHALVEDDPVLTTHSLGPRVSHAIVESAPGHDPQADFSFNAGTAIGEGADLGQRIEQTLYEANGMTGQGQVLSNYGFTGRGQTVAVIDTGIAYNHYALGGGVGANYRVVGGWDFTENDANFYDDGPTGGHGTHVAGIVGAVGDGIHSGVATGVDLVGLRVFDDAGNGYFSWVESALRWVHNNRNSFANPITAINLSLGTEWNSNSNPSWANLEDEFAQLVADGIFISVSAGNSFTNYNTNGVSYPASSDHVVPVMSLDPNGSLSYYSQRAEYALAAPGRYITSTVPDYAANDADTIDDDWLSMSGTSMAAPYVAGASTLVRQAMEFVGQTGIDQWDIYNHLMTTADTFYDSATATNYKKLNLWTAINTLMPTDDYGSTTQTAHNLGTINEGPGPGPLSNVSGVISTLADGDYFRFTAGATGRVTVSASDTTHELVESWQAWGGNWSTNSSGDCVIDVVAGQTYTFAITTAGGLGYYDLAIDLEATFAPIELGALGAQQTATGLSVSGEQWYRVTAGRAGYLTADLQGVTGTASVAIYNAQMNALTTAGSRVDTTVAAGQQLYLRVTGSSTSFNLRTTNAVTLSGAVATVVGTSGNDVFTFAAGASLHTATLNGLAYTFSASTTNDLRFDGASGNDSITLTGTSAAETARLWSNDAALSSSGYRATSTRFETHTVNGAGGADTAYLYDTSGADAYVVNPTSVAMTGTGYAYTAASFETTYAYSTGGGDTATFHDSTGADIYRSYSDRAILSGTGFYHRASGFGDLSAYASNTSDVAMIYDTAGDDVYDTYGDRVVMTGSGYVSRAFGFGSTQGYASAGVDTANAYDTVGNDFFRAYSDRVVMSGAGYNNRMSGFDTCVGYSTSGFDTAWMYDSAGNDTYRAYHDHVIMQGGGFLNRANAFDETYAFSTAGGQDTAYFYGSAGADLFRAYQGRSIMSGDTYFNRATGFRTVHAQASGTGDAAWFYESALDDAFAASGSGATTTWGDGSSAQGTGFGSVRAIGGSGGSDTSNVSAIDFAFTQIGAWV